MSIHYNPEQKIITLETDHTAYQMRITDLNCLLHTYYGRKTGDAMDYLFVGHDCGFSPNPYEARLNRSISLDLAPQEYSGANTGDYRTASVDLAAENGVRGVGLRYAGHEIISGKYAVAGMPSAFDRGGECETLKVTLTDAASGLEAELLYGVFAGQDVITRAVRLINRGTGTLELKKVASMCLDLPSGNWDMIHFHGRHVMERQLERAHLITGVQSVLSRRGSSSHQQNPFVILCESDATEDFGGCYGMMLAYSGSHRTDVEVDQQGSVRAVMGMNDDLFSWKLEPGESFDTPEVLLTFTDRGLTHLSQTYHRFLRGNMIRSKFGTVRRPILINNWEATYFHFNTEKILSIARQARELGVEMLVLDDGWFGKRNDDNAGLGDWYVNESKLPGGLTPLIGAINDMGMKFGIWVEPEMVNEDSDLYRAHPDWVLTVPGRKPAVSRNQLVLDLSRKDVVDWLYGTLAGLLRSYHIEYIKWDMNRNLADVYSRLLPPDRQGEVLHRYVLGLYDLLERLTSEFPDVLIEGCSGGGGRFDAAMLAYCPQIWCSDDSDAIERLTIQYGTSFGYPISAVGAHVSACPNHQTGRNTPLGTRAVTAMAGTFGYELDLGKLSESEKEQVREQIQRFDEYYELIQNGDYYRLGHWQDNGFFTAWQTVAPDRSETLVSAVMVRPRPNLGPVCIKCKGLDPDAVYETVRAQVFGSPFPMDQYLSRMRRRFTGAALMYGGYVLPFLHGEYPSVQIRMKKCRMD